MQKETATQHREWVEAATVHVRDAADLLQARAAIVDALDKYHIARISGLVSRAEMQQALTLLTERLDVANDRATTGEHAEEVRGVFQKLSIGRARHGNVDRPRFMRVFYDQLTGADTYAMHGPFERLTAVRNVLMNQPLDFAFGKDDGGMWTAARLHHFPTGGGFMVSHKDTILPAITKEQSLGAYFQPLLLVTQKGDDFETGGGFAQVRGEKVSYEDYAGQGDIVIYDSRTEHGVDDIDVHLPYRQNSMRGRISALVTLYKVL